MSSDEVSNLLFAIPSGPLLELLRRARAGEDPDMLVAEIYANAAAHHDSAREMGESLAARDW